MRAIVDIQGKQYEVVEGRYVQVDLCAGQENDTLVFENVRLVVAGDQSLVGAPYIEGAVVTTRVKRHGRGPKILVYKMRCKKGYRRKNGHRQGFTELQVESVDFPGKEQILKLVQPEATLAQKAERPKAKKPTAAAKAEAAPEATTAVEEKPEKAPAKPKTAKTAAKPKAKAAEVPADETQKEKKPKAPKAAAEAPEEEKAPEKAPEAEAVTASPEENVVETPPVTEETQTQPGETD